MDGSAYHKSLNFSATYRTLLTIPEEYYGVHILEVIVCISAMVIVTVWEGPTTSAQLSTNLNLFRASQPHR